MYAPNNNSSVIGMSDAEQKQSINLQPCQQQQSSFSQTRRIN